jgi:hypothetical protein
MKYPKMINCCNLSGLLKKVRQCHFGRECRQIFLAMTLLLPAVAAPAAGTWTRVVAPPPDGMNSCILLSDGSVLGMNQSGACVKLTPNDRGSYVNGTWSTLAPMHDSRIYFSSQLLTNGNLWVAGGEDGSGGSGAELYSSLNNVWTVIPPPPAGYPDFSDSISEILPDGNPFVTPVFLSTGCLIYNVSSNLWQTAASADSSQDESDWVKLPSDNIVTIDAFSQNSEHYIPSLNEWAADGEVPVTLFDPTNNELGSGHLLPNGSVFYLGSTTNTAIYTPGAAVTSAGSWVAGRGIPKGQGAPDAPAAMMVNGRILCCLGPWGTLLDPCSFYEYDYISDTFTRVSAPGGGSALPGMAPFKTSMLDLPDGTVLFIDGQNGSTLYIYTPDGTPLAAGQPVIDSVSQNPDGSYHLTGTGLNGISEGAAYGDDEQMSGNYPLVRLTNTISGNVYYARTYNWNSTSVQTGSRVLTTEFSLPQNLPAGSYSLVVTAVGNPSEPQTFTYAPPPAPTGLSAASGSNAFVNLQWDTTAGATTYDVKRGTTLGGYFETVATVNGTNWTDTGLTNGFTYYYKVSSVGSGGQSSDSTAVTATPAGPPLIPGATPIPLASYYNRAGIFMDGKTYGTGIDGSGSAFSENLLGQSLLWNNLVFSFGPPNATDVVSCTSQTITLPAGHFTLLQILGTGLNLSQTARTFTVTYTDNSTAKFTQSFSDWANPQSYPGEATVVQMPYRNLSSGASQALAVSVDGYVFTLDQTRTVKSITLPNDPNIVLLSMALANDQVSVSLGSYYNRAGIYTDNTTFTNPPTGGLDGDGFAYSGTLLGNSQTWSNTVFTFGPLNATNVISCTGQTVALAPGNYSCLRMLATGVSGSQSAQSLVVTYTDATTTTFLQGFSDWFVPEDFAGESQVVVMNHRNDSDGTVDRRTFILYGYSFTLDSTKAVQSIQLPDNPDVIVTAISLDPNWPPTFLMDPQIFSTITFQSRGLQLSWSGGIAPYQVQAATNLVNPDWQNIGGLVSSNSLSITPSNSATFYRIVGQ